MANQIYGLIGHPVAHSLSPAMHNAAFKALGMDAEYLLYDVEPGDGLEVFLRDIPDSGVSGLNVTIPHKIRTGLYLEKHGTLDENAKRLGAVNTIKVVDNRLCGYNTDGPGFYRSLIEDLKFEPEGKNIFVMGAGGASTAIVMYLGNGPRKIFVSDVETGKAEDLKSRYKKHYDVARIAVVGEEARDAVLKETHLLINATPLGMKETDPLPIDKNCLRSGLYVYDLVYNRPVTQLVKEAQRARCHAITGLGMLLYQGAIAFEIWTGKKAPVAVMKKALKDSLKARIGV